MSKMVNSNKTVKLDEEVLDQINGGTSGGSEFKKRDEDSDGKRLGDVKQQSNTRKKKGII